MFARRGTFAADPARADEFIAMTENTRNFLQDLQGVEAIYICMNRETGEGMTLGVYADEAASAAARPTIMKAWEPVMPMLTEPPVFTEFTSVERVK